MSKSLLFLPDISGFTQFVQTTEVEHSQHVIKELLEILIEANTLEFTLAEVEGDALFFYKENSIPSQEKLLAQIETMFTVFYRHLKLLETNRICPCNACATAPNLQLKIIAHCGELQFMEVQGNRKPFGQEVIQAHRLMKNSVQSNNYTLLSKALIDEISLKGDYKSMLYHFNNGSDMYDGQKVHYAFSIIDNEKLRLDSVGQSLLIHFDHEPQLTYKKEFLVSAGKLLEYISNYRYRKYWVKGVNDFEFNENEVTRLGTEHVCVIDKKRLNFTTVKKKVQENQLVYGELTTSPPPVDELYQFFIITPLTDNSCKLNIEVYWKAKSPIKKLMIALVVKKLLKKNITSSMKLLQDYIQSTN